MTETLVRLQTALADRYRIERLLGEGGMAMVYLAHDLKHDRPVAVKVLRPELAAFLGPDRFLREIHLAAQLTHPHILGLHDSGDAAGLLYYVMPYVDGDSLRRLIERDGPLPIDEALRIAAEVADGLAYAHELGVVHRDIKPENILLSHRHAAITDFGIARALAGASAGPHTATGVSVGTPTYMSPEQARGDPAIDYRADIYSLGCTLYEMLTGLPPYEAPTAQALLIAHARAQPPSVRAHRHDVPFALDEAVRRAMAKTPEERFQSAAELRDLLLDLVTPNVTTAHRRLTLAFLRRRARVGALAVLAAVAVAGISYALMGRRAPPAAEVPQRLRVVVRYLEDRTGGLRALADGITEALTHRLESVPALAVAAGAVVAELRDAPLDSLRARFAPERVVVGRVERARDGVRATVEVLDPATDRTIADTTVSIPAGSAADAAAEPLSEFVRHVFWADLDRAQRRSRVRDPAARGLVSRAREQMGDAEEAVTLRFDRQGFRALDRADSLLREARRRDGSSDLIPVEQARLAERRAFYVEWLRQALPDLPATLPSPRAERMRALADLDRLIHDRRGPADAYELRGHVKEGLWRESGADSLLDGATADYQAATDLDRHFAAAWSALASAYLSAGSFAEALLAVLHADAEDAFRIYRKDLLRTRFDAALRAERFDVAAEACQAGFVEAALDPRFRDCALQLWSRTRSDRGTAAAAHARADSLAVNEPLTIMIALRALWVAEVYARAGLGDSADQIARRAALASTAAWRPFVVPEEAYLRLLRGDRDSALALIEAAARSDPTAPRALRTSPWFTPLRDDPRFRRAVGGRPASAP